MPTIKLVKPRISFGKFNFRDTFFSCVTECVSNLFALFTEKCVIHTKYPDIATKVEKDVKYNQGNKHIVK